MISRTGTGFDVECEYCPHTEEHSVDEFQDVIDRMKDRGWKIFKEDGEWMHKCPDCAERR